MGYRHTEVRGRFYPPWANSACLGELQQEFKLRGSDIVIATYPKCGTTWMQQIVLTLLHGGDKSKVLSPMLQAPWIEFTTCGKRAGMKGGSVGKPMSLEELLSWDGQIDALPMSPRRVFKTHAAVDLVPWKGGAAGCGGAKVVVVTRNPKDACVSMFNHVKGVPFFAYKGDFQHFVRALFLRGSVVPGCFWEWHAGWERAAEERPGTVMWVSFEELKRDFPGTVRRLGEFLDVPVPEELIAQTQAASSFQSMTAQAAKVDATFQARGLNAKKNHLRKGAMGSWRSDIDGELLAEFDAVHTAKTALNGLKYAFDFGDP